MQASEWSKCGDRCWSTGGTYKTRVVQCVETSPTGSQTVAVVTKCQGQAPPETVMECDATPCSGPFWLAATDWSPCSQPCIANLTDPAGLGLTVSSPARCVQVMNGTMVPATEALCGPQTQVRRGTVCTIEEGKPPGPLSLSLELWG